MTCGASMGDGYGPCVVARDRLAPADLAGATVAVPGTLTSAYLALRLYLGREIEHRVVPFDRIPAAVLAREVDAGLIIHESQLTYRAEGLHLVVDLGAWWAEHTGGLPLPLGANVVRRDLGREAMARLTAVLRDSIEHGLTHRDAALDYALGWGRGLPRQLADRFVGMYVNDLTRDYGERGRRAIDRFLGDAAAAGLVPRTEIEFVAPAD
jgi:1,4-dihydroxy-6-naphthoate synthase